MRIVDRDRLAANVPLFYVYYFLNSFILDRAIWMLFLVSRGFSLTEIALIESAYHLTGFLLEVPTGYVADRFGKRISLLTAQVIGALSSAMLIAGHGSVAVAGFMIGAVAGTFQSGATSAIVYETLKRLGREESFKRVNSQLSGIMLATLGLSGIAGGGLSDIDWAWVYGGKIALNLLTFGIVYLMVEPPEDQGLEGESAGARYSFWRQLGEGYAFARTSPAFLALCTYGAVLYAMSWSIAFYSQVLFQQFGMNNRAIGVVNGVETWLSAGIAAVAFLGERRLGKRGSIWTAGIGFSICLLLFATSDGPTAGIAAFLLMAVFISYLEPLLEAYLNELLPTGIRATMLSVFSMMISTGMMATFSVLGYLADRSDLATALGHVMLVWGPLCLAALVWASRRLRKS